MAKPFCSECGAPTIIECESCGAKIQGRVHIDSVISLARWSERRHTALIAELRSPWTQSNIEAVHELLDIDEKLSDTDRDTMRSILPDLLAQTPKTQLAVVKARAIMKNMDDATYGAIKEIIGGFASETVKKPYLTTSTFDRTVILRDIRAAFFGHLCLISSLKRSRISRSLPAR